MRLVVFGATGGVGGHLLRQSLDAGHEVTAVVRDPSRLPHTAARVVRADLLAPDPAVLRDALDGAGAVLSGLGARTAAEARAGIARRGTRAIVDAMRAAGVRRIVVVSAASVGTVPSPGRRHPPKHNPGDGFFMRHLAAPLAKRAFRHQYADLALMEDVLRDSDLDWTVARPPRLLGGRATGRYRVAYDRNVRGGMFIRRSDVAHLMLATLTRPETVHHALAVAY
jgi:putative NADH-flavin reductase